MTRETVAQQRPSVPLDDVPVHELTAPTEVFRAHHRAHGPWWFSSAGGRFDLPTPRGTCYLADDPLAALRERLGIVLGHAPSVPVSLLEDAVVSRLHLARSARLADLQSRRAARFGITRELETMVPYAVPHAWALALAAVGLEGVRYSPRFTTGPAASYAVFGPAGVGEGEVDPAPIAGAEVPGAPVAVEPPRRWDLTVVRPPRTRGRA